jgi:hypothetical protein
MANLEVDYDETTGKIGTLPEPIQKFVDRLIAETGGKLRATITKDVETQYAEKLKAVDPVEREKLQIALDENGRFKIAEQERKAEYEKALKLREEAETARETERNKALDATKVEITRRDVRLREMAKNEIKIAAKTLGARTESLTELAALLGADLDLDPDLQPFVKGADGKPAVDKDGKPVSIEGFVHAYLDTHPHHRVSVAGAGGGARGGASIHSSTLTGPALRAQQTLDDVNQRIAKKGSPSAADINEQFKAIRGVRAAAAGK